MAAFLLLFGIFIGGVLVILVEYLIFFNPFGKEDSPPLSTRDQFEKFQLPREIRQLLTSRGGSESLKKRENCVSLNLFLQFLFQESRESRGFRRWILKRLQLELNDLVSRSTAGRLVQDIQIRDLNVGSQFPVIRDVQVDKVQLSEDTETFEELDLVLSIDYRGGFRVSLDVTAVLGRKASLAVKLTTLSGRARLRLTRFPYTHWSLTFLQEPHMDFAVDSHFQGRVVPQLVPLIIQQFRRAVRRKHVLPRWKLRHRPFFVNPLLQPSPDPDQFRHISLTGLLQLSVRSASRLNVSITPHTSSTQVYCVVSLSPKPVSPSSSDQSISMMIRMLRRSYAEDVGLSLVKQVGGPGGFWVRVSEVSGDSPADKSGFLPGDCLLAINNLPVVNERHALKLLSNTIGELFVLIERNLSNISDEEEVAEHLVALTPTEKLSEAHSSQEHESPMERSLSAPILPFLFDIDEEGIACTEAPPNEWGNIKKLKKWTSANDLQIILSSGGQCEIECETETLDGFESSTPSEVGAWSEKASEEEEPSVRRRMTRKATERMAQKWTTVKGIWQKHRAVPVKDLAMEELPPQLPNSRSEDAKLVEKASMKEIDQSSLRVEASMTRSRSRSEPDAKALSVHEDGLPEEPRHSSLPVQSPSAPRWETSHVQLDSDVIWNQDFFLDLDRKTRYVNISVFAKNESCPSLLLGSVSLLVPEVLNECSMTLSNYNQETLVLRPPSGQFPLPTKCGKLTGHPGFDGRLCCGDLTLGFLWHPDGHSETVAPEQGLSQNFQMDSEAKGETKLDASCHKWLNTHFNQSVFCGFCARKIWLKTASQCVDCMLICHKKCQPKADELMTCGGKVGLPTIRKELEDSWESVAAESVTEAVSVSMDESSVPAGRGRRLQLALTQKIHSLRRRKFDNTEQILASEGKYPSSKTQESSKLLVEGGQFQSVTRSLPPSPLLDRRKGKQAEADEPRPSGRGHNLLYTEGGTYNEHVIHAAKDLGRSLFSGLAIPQRKAKINEQIDQLQIEIDEVTRIRLEILGKLKECAGSGSAASWETELDRIDDKLQGLAVLMLHYCAGLQNCLDLEEKAEEEELPPDCVHPHPEDHQATLLAILNSQPS